MIPIYEESQILEAIKEEGLVRNAYGYKTSKCIYIYTEGKEKKDIWKDLKTPLHGFEPSHYDSNQLEPVDYYLLLGYERVNELEYSLDPPTFKLKKENFYVCKKDYYKGENLIGVRVGEVLMCKENGVLKDRYGDLLEGNLSEFFRSWTIDDAKPGELLVYGDNTIFEYHGKEQLEGLKGKEHLCITSDCYYQVSTDKFFDPKVEGKPWGLICMYDHCKDVIWPATPEQAQLFRDNIVWEPRDGDIIRFKKDDGTKWQIFENTKGLFNGRDFTIHRIMENGLSGGDISRFLLKEYYTLIERSNN